MSAGMNIDEFRKKLEQSITTIEKDKQKFFVDLDEDVRAVALEVLPEAMDALLDTLNAALKGREYGVETGAVGISGCAHQIKGMAGTAGYPEISAVGEKLEQAALEHDYSRCKELIELLKEWDELVCQ